MDWKENVGMKEKTHIVQGSELEEGKTAVSSQGESAGAKNGWKEKHVTSWV